ncbi:alcohol dehydrogenase catalytic domain-containing protein [Microbacterium sp. cf332]|uniref:alcohol dehydrogenase catalytic domain-containing protein n=1 Tax=Microbacterium sp. cf332 TaxID=1761804 RepID=UPI0008866B92|nr:alcohol dehydrogenase catalytic domain-containing protein [Microbacterium sp. cf332]SDQ89391.1 L-iditol 2-dehydrogenase [Microbacterium sp. cf332]
MSAGADRMMASVLVEPRRLEVRDVPVPAMEPGDVLVELTAVGLCGSDVHFFEHGRVGDLVVERPLILGHEAAGVIAAVASPADEHRVGQRVAIDPQRPCRWCPACRAGRSNLCERMRFPSAPPEDGAFARYLAVPADAAHPLPDTMSDDEGALVEPLSVGIAAVRKAGVVPGSRVLVAGAGPIGVLTGAAARAFGAAEVVVADPIAARREVALAHGATRAVDPDDVAALDGRMDAFVDASGARAAIAAGLRSLRGAGRAVLVGMGAASVELDLFLVQSRELVIEGLFRYVDTWPLAIHLVSSGAVRVDDLVTARGGLDDLADFFARNSAPDAMKFLVDPRVRRLDGPGR